MTDSSQRCAAPVRALNTVLYCAHFARTVTFYEQVLGLQRGFCNDWFVEFKVAQAACLSLADERRASIKSAAGAGITLTLRVDDVRATHAQLRARGAEPGEPGPRPWGAEGFFVHDPEGTRIEIWAPIDGAP